MPIRQQTQSVSETVESFEAAAEEKYEDGFNLIGYASPGSGIYLMGYAVEMLLKSAYFRIAGFDTQRVIARRDLSQAKIEASHLLVTASDEHYHNLAFWGELIIKKRVSLTRGLAPALEAELAHRTQRLAQNWFVEMRYLLLPSVVMQDVDDVLDDVVWIKSSHEDLWR